MAKRWLDSDGSGGDALAVAPAVADGLTDSRPGLTFIGASIDEFPHAGVELSRHRFLRPALVVAQMHGISHHEAQDSNRSKDAPGHGCGGVVLDREDDHRRDAQCAGQRDDSSESSNIHR